MAGFLARGLTTLAILIGSLGAANVVEAHEPTRTEPDEFELEVRFEALPLVGLQPEIARLVLDLPLGMLPRPRTWYGFDFDGSIKQWDFDAVQVGRPIRRAHRRSSASLGVGFRLILEDSRRTVRFRMSVLPRAAVAVLSF